MNALLRGFTVAILTVAVSGCSLFSGEEEVGPNPLVEFEAEKEAEVLWSVSVGDQLGEFYNQFQPAISGDAIFTTDKAGALHAIDRSNGDQLWERDLETSMVGGVGAGYGKLFVTAERGELIVLDADTGEDLWRAVLSSEAVAPAQANSELVLVQQIDGKVVAFDLESGARRWSYTSPVPKLTLRGTGVPIVTQNVTFVSFSSGKLVALDNASGDLLWERRISVPQGRSALERMVDADGRMLIKDRTLFAASFQGSLIALNPLRAQILWSQDVSTFHSLSAGYGNIYVSDAADAVQAFDQRSSASVWTQASLGNRSITAPVSIGNAVAVGDSEGYIHFMSQVDGRFIARVHTSSDGLRGDLLVKGNQLYALSNDSRLYAVELR
ncbi:outer membrane protein assembly factor BamB [Marinobacterium jannaschii]|uniref:outer membrane protein assembly factor BamB n=1 Tax=Marinobacterium jannaschii TaxID=64970 RepID=UPI000684ACD0|nr:outer membrane protein assembly factor BamB [Marinobacterium jannaschii]